MRISRAGIELIKSFEGYSSRTVRIDDQHWIIGYGHVRSDNDQYRVSKDEAEQILKEYDLPPLEQLILENTYTPLHQGAFDALVSFAFNIGKDAFLSSDVLSLLNAGETLAAADAMANWRKASVKGKTIVVDALVRRRAAEISMFLADPSGPAPAPSAIVKPILDASITSAPSLERSIVIESKGVASEPIIKPVETERRRNSEAAVAAQNSLTRLTRRFSEALEDTKDNVAQDTYSPPRDQEIVDPNSGPTPEEITAAISELVNGAGAQEDLQFTEDLPGFDIDDLDPVDDVDLPNEENDDDLEPYPGLEFVPVDEARGDQRFERTLGNDNEPYYLPASDGPILIDDLEPVDVDDIDIQRAVKLHEEMEAEGTGTRTKNWGPFAFLAFIGIALFSWATWRYQSSDAPLSLNIIMMITGALLFAVMSYYFVREFVKLDD